MRTSLVPRRAVRAVAVAAALAVSGLGAITAANAATPAAAPAATSANDAQWLTGYWHNFDNGSVVMPLSEIPEAYNLVAVAFAENHPTLSGGIDFTLETRSSAATPTPSSVQTSPTSRPRAAR